MKNLITIIIAIICITLSILTLKEWSFYANGIKLHQVVFITIEYYLIPGAFLTIWHLESRNNKK